MITIITDVPLTIFFSGRGGGQVVSMLAFYSDDPSSNPADIYSFFCKICVWKEQKQTKKRPGWPIKKFFGEASFDVMSTGRGV